MKKGKSHSKGENKGVVKVRYSPTVATSQVATVNVNQADFRYVGEPNLVFDLNNFYQAAGVNANVVIKEVGAVKVADNMTTGIPRANKKYMIGFSIFDTMDEVDSMILTSMQAAADESGVELLVNDANYKQDVQDQAVEKWIRDGVDGVILAPCDFTGVKTSLDSLEAANIPVVTLNAPLAGNINAAVISDTVEQGTISGELLEEVLQKSGKPMKGEIVYQTLPFMHPNAATRAKGFKDVFSKYPEIKITELTGISPEEHFKAFSYAIKANPHILGAWGLYSSATIGMMNAQKSTGSKIPLSSVDNDKIILIGIEKGEIIGTAAYSAIASARLCMSEMVNLLNGAPIPGIIFYENMKITKTNVAEAFSHYYPGMTLKDYKSDKKL